jgi:hypothetical protein
LVRAEALPQVGLQDKWLRMMDLISSIIIYTPKICISKGSEVDNDWWLTYLILQRCANNEFHCWVHSYLWSKGIVKDKSWILKLIWVSNYLFYIRKPEAFDDFIGPCDIRLVEFLNVARGFCDNWSVLAAIHIILCSPCLNLKIDLISSNKLVPKLLRCLSC